MYTNSLAIGKVWHKRYAPTIHEFNYDLNAWFLNIDNPHQDMEVVNKLKLYRFNEKKYIRDYCGSLASKVRQKIRNLGGVVEDNQQIFMLGQLSNCGLYFSPLNLYFCFNQAKCNYVLAEVSNTPWNERHYYLIDMLKEQYVVNKNFHVSPFFSLAQTYQWSFTINEDTIKFQIDNYEHQKKVFSAAYSVKLIPFTQQAQIKQHIIRQPFSVWKIVAAIYYEALKLFIKKVPFIPYQENKTHV